jgi:hypothetical protein
MKYDPGCYGDSVYGAEHITLRIFGLSMENGWLPIGDEWVLDAVIDGKTGSIPPEVIQGMEDGAIDFLNENVSEEGYLWGFENGDFGYWEQWE